MSAYCIKSFRCGRLQICITIQNPYERLTHHNLIKTPPPPSELSEVLTNTSKSTRSFTQNTQNTSHFQQNPSYTFYEWDQCISHIYDLYENTQHLQQIIPSITTHDELFAICYTLIQNPARAAFDLSGWKIFSPSATKSSQHSTG